MSAPVPPVIMSSPAPATITLVPLVPVSVSAKREPVTFSNSEIVSRWASPPEAVLVARLIVTPVVTPVLELE